MSRGYYRYFGPFLKDQERWLNRMADRGLRLAEVGKLRYAFTPCPPGQVRYCVEFVGQKSREEQDRYGRFLEELGYRVFFRSVNLDFYLGKIRLRPWADRGGRWAVSGGSYGREILIVEKENDGVPFQLHTTWADRAAAWGVLRRPWLFLAAFLGIMALAVGSPALGGLALAALIPAAYYQIRLARDRRRAQTEEW